MPSAKVIKDEELQLVFERKLVGKNKEEAELEFYEYNGFWSWEIIIDGWKRKNAIQKGFPSFSKAIAWLKAEKFTYKGIWDGVQYVSDIPKRAPRR